MLEELRDQYWLSFAEKKNKNEVSIEEENSSPLYYWGFEKNKNSQSIEFVEDDCLVAPLIAPWLKPCIFDYICLD